MFKLAMIQMIVEGGQPEGNLTHAAELVGEAAHAGSQVILLPEALDLGWTHPSAKTLAEPLPDGKHCRYLRKLAAEHQVYLCAGLIEQCGDGVYNSAVIINPNGEVILTHRKLNELTIGHEYYAQGDHLNVCQTEFGAFGLMICADAFADGEVISRSLCYMGADVILAPCSWALQNDHQPDQGHEQPCVNMWRHVYRPVAYEYQVYIAGCSNVGPISAGPWQGYNAIGCSLLYGPQGEEIFQGPYGPAAEQILYHDVDPVPRPARGTEWSER